MNQEVVFSGVICKFCDDDSAAVELSHGRETNHARSSDSRVSLDRNRQASVSATDESPNDSGVLTQGLKT